MSQYYLMSQLPSLDGISENMPLPITEERFYELCSRFLGKRSLGELKSLTLVPSRDNEKCSSALVAEWNSGERKLRLALAKARAEKLKKPFDTQNESFPVPLLQVAHTAVELDSPLEAESFLNSYRLGFLETLRPMDSFCEDSVFYYGLKLKLLARIRGFDRDKGEAAYKNIYGSIIDGDRPEVL